MPTFSAACWVEYVITLVLIAYLGVEVTRNREVADAIPGDIAKARAAYQHFLTLWRDADVNPSAYLMLRD